MVPAKRGVIGKMEKKMTSGIVSLTRPRFGKRSVVDEAEVGDGEDYEDLLAAELMSPLTKAIYVYLVKNYGTPINNKPTRSSAKMFSNLTRPRYGKRSLHGPGAVLNIIQVTINVNGEMLSYAKFQELHKKQAEKEAAESQDEM